LRLFPAYTLATARDLPYRDLLTLLYEAVAQEQAAYPDPDSDDGGTDE